jgi:PAS domain S-box-containing protein
LKNINLSKKATLPQKAASLQDKKLPPLTSDTKLSDPKVLKHIQELELQLNKLELAKREIELTATKYAELFEKAPTAHFIFSREGVILDLNEAAASTLGKSPLKLKNSAFGKYISIDTKNIFNCFLDTLFNSECNDSCELTLQIKGRLPMYVQLSGCITGNSKSCIVHLIDLSNHKQKEASLLESEVLYQSILKASPDDISITDLEGRILHISHSALTIFGYNREEEILGRLLSDFVVPADIERVWVNMAFLFQGININPGEYSGLRRDGSSFSIEVNANLIRDTDGKPIKMIIIVRDIHERKLSEAILASTSQLLKRTAEMAKVGGWELDLRTHHRFWSKETCHILEINPAVTPSIGEGINLSFYAPEALPMIQAAVEAGIKFGTSFDLELPMITRKGKHIWVRDQGHFLMENGKAIKVYGVMQDITDRKQAEELLKKSNHNLSVINELASELSSLDTSEDLFSYITKKLKKITHAQGATLALYNSQKKELNVAAAELNPDVMAPIVDAMGGIDLSQINFPVSEDIRINLIKTPIKIGLSLSEVTCGLVAPPNEKIEGEIQNSFRYVGIAYIVAGELFGTSILMFHPNQPDPSIEMLKSFVHLVAVSLRRKLAEKDMNEAMNRLQKIADLVPGVVYQFLLRPDGTSCFPYASEGIKKIYRVTPEEVKEDAAKVFAIIHPDELEAVAASIETSAKNLTYWNQETRVRFKDGTIRFLQGNAAPQREMDGSVLWHGFITDVTERKLSEEALKESELKYRELVENSPDAIVIYIDGKVVYVNKECIHLMTASSAEDLVGKSVFQFVRPESMSIVRKRMKKIKTTGFILPIIEEKFVRLNGLEVDVEVKAMPVRFKNKQAVQLIIRDITERKQMLNALSLSENRYKTLFEKASDGILIMNATGKILSINESFAHMHGYTVDELLQMNLRTLDTPEMAQLLPKMIARVLGGETVHLDVDHFHKDGHIISFAISSSLIHVGDESYIQAFHTDITERRNAERVLRESEAMNRALISSIPDLIFTNRRDGEYLAVHASNPDLLYVPPEKLLHKKIRDILPTAIADQLEKAGENALDTGILQEVSYWLPMEKGKNSFFEARVVPFTTDTVISFIRDVTQRKLAEEKFLQLSLAVEQSPASIVITNTEGLIEYVNPKFVALTGYSLDEVIGKNPRILKSGHTTGEEYHHLWETISEGAEWHGEFNNIKKNGELYWESASISPIFNEKGKVSHFLAIKEDITERKKADEKLLQYAADLESSNNELENFAYVASHDLQEPLRMVSSFLTLLQERMHSQLDETNQQYIHFAVDGAQRMKILINDLLQYSRVGTNIEKFNVTPLNEVLQYVLLVLKDKIEKTKAVITLQDLPVITANKALLNQLFVNLLSNALKYNDSKPPEIEIGCKEELDKYIFYVKDNGIGIDPKFHEKVFVIFQRLHGKTQYSGTGIGLAVCKKIVAIHSGKIWLESEPGIGSTFYFSIPK